MKMYDCTVYEGGEFIFKKMVYIVICFKQID